MRTFNLSQQFDAMKSAAEEAVKSIFPVEGKLRRISLDKVYVEDKLNPEDYADQQKTKAKGGTWGVPVYADLSLYEKEGNKLIDRASKIRLFLLPKGTPRFSYIVNGNEYQVHNQLRLKSGVYNVRKQNGELRSQINLAKGANFDIIFNEQKAQFVITKVGGTQANIPLYPILIHLGIPHSKIVETWGQKIADANRSLSDNKAVDKAVGSFGVRKGGLQEYFEGTKMDPSVAERTIGGSFDRVSGDMLLATSKKLLDVQMGRQQPDDRDSLEFKELHSLDDFIKERLVKNRIALEYKIKRSIDNLKRTKLTQIVNPGAFSSVVESFFTSDDKSATPEQTNPLEMLSGQWKTTIMGSGGIKSSHSVTPEMREVHNSHFGFLDPVHTPESDKIGATLSLPLGAVKDGNQIKKMVFDVTGKVVLIDPTTAFNKKIAFPDQRGKIVKAMYRGETIEIPDSQVDYWAKDPKAMFTWSSNLVPYLASDQGNRSMMAAKQMEQAISLKNREVPLVQVGAGQYGTMEANVGRRMVPVAPDDGVVKKIDKDSITIKTKNGDVKLGLYNNFALNRKSFMHHTPLVAVGDKVKKDQILADNNFTKNGVLALGTNLKAAYMTYHGYNHDDGIVITESAAKKLTSEHIHREELDIDDNIITGLNKFRMMYPNAMTAKNADKLESDGIIKKGQKVVMGDIVIAALQKRAPLEQVGLVQKQLSQRPKNISQTWPYEDEGEVVDVQKSGRHVTVFIKTNEAARIGDKLTGRHGNKGIITKIIPDEHAPRTKDGPVDIMLNPHGVVSRINIGQIYESAAAKAADKAGKLHVVNNFSNENHLENTKKLLEMHGVEDKEELHDPITGKSLGKVHVGKPYILKLYKQSQGNFSYRQGGPGSAYDANMQPLKQGGEESAKGLDMLTINSLLSHGARANLKDMMTIKSDKNDEYWTALKSGQVLPAPKNPFVYNKFVNYLKGAGIDVKKEGTKLTLAPLTDKQILTMSSGEVKEPVFFRGKDMKPEKGGFMDPVKFGGMKGEGWGHIELKESTVNPVFENAVKKITGLGSKYDDIMAGKLFLHDGEFNREGRGITSGKAIEKLLKDIDVDSQISVLQKKIKTAKGNTLDEVNKKLRYLLALQSNKMKPHEAYIRKVVPIVPPAYRPIYSLPDGNVTSSDVNYLYQNLGVLNKLSQMPVADMLAEEEKAELRNDIQHHIKGISGLTDVNIKGKEREGFISEIKGGSGGQPKEGFFISKMLSKKQDYVGRGTAIPEVTLGVDQVGIPEKMAWKLFEPFVVREMGRMGKNPNAAKKEIEDKTPLAQKVLEKVMEDRHVLLKRDPSLHKFSIMAFKPVLTTGTAIKVQPLVNKGFNLDYDGDTMMAHVPISDAANREAERFLPSRNIFQPGTGKIMLAPDQEAQTGLFYLSQSASGRKHLVDIIGPKYYTGQTLTKGAVADLLKKIAKELPPNEYAKIVNDLKQSGEQHVFTTGFTLGLNDLQDLSSGRDKIINRASAAIKKAKTPDEIAKITKESNSLLDMLLDSKLKGKQNPLYDMVASGAKGSGSQLRSIMATPLLVTDSKGRTIPSVIKKSYAEGLDTADYWTSAYGARRGMMDRAIQTSLPGTFSKDIMASTLDNVISAKDCGTKKGITIAIDNPDILDRFTAADQEGVTRNTLIDSHLVAVLKKKGVKSLLVRSPTTCLQPKGTCSKCFGLDEHGKEPAIGENIGAKSGQTMAEPLIQMTMNSFHSGGTAGTKGQVGGYKRIDDLLKMPEILKGAATLAPVSGIVSKVEKGLAGGFDVTINGQKVHTTSGLDLKVKQGDKVKAGDPLSEGVIKPQELVKLKGMHEAQQYIVDELHGAYKGQGVNMQRKIFETVVRSVGNLTKILSNNKHADVIPGDIAPYTMIQHHNENLVKEVPVDEAEGDYLAEGIGGMRTGHELTHNEIAALKKNGIRTVKIKLEPIEHEPILKGITTIPILKKNWMSALGYRNLAKTLTEGAGQSWSTQVHDYHPVPALAYGKEFGEGEEGKY